MSKKRSIVILTENNLLKEMLIKKINSLESFEILGNFASGDACENFLSKSKCDLLIVDLIMSNVDGVGILYRLRTNCYNAFKHVVCLSDFTSPIVFGMLEKLNVDYCFKKPIDLEYLMNIVKFIFNSSPKKIIIENNKILEIDNIVITLTKLGTPHHLKGYNYLVTAMNLVSNNINLLGEITKELYPQIAREHATTASRVEQAIRHAIKITWQSGCDDELEKIFGYRMKNKPSNSEFISTIVDMLLLKYKN